VTKAAAARGARPYEGFGRRVAVEEAAIYADKFNTRCPSSRLLTLTDPRVDKTQTVIGGDFVA